MYQVEQYIGVIFKDKRITKTKMIMKFDQFYIITKKFIYIHHKLFFIYYY